MVLGIALSELWLLQVLYFKSLAGVLGREECLIVGVYGYKKRIEIC